MKVIYSAIILLASTAVLAQTAPAQTESQQLQQNVQQRQDNSRIKSVIISSKIKEIRDELGFEVECPTLFTELNDDLCIQGLNNLQQGLSDIESPVAREELSSFTIYIGEKNSKHGVTTERRMTVPYNTEPAAIRELAVEQLPILFAEESGEVEKVNKDLEQNLREKYFVSAIKGPGVSTNEYNVALQKLTMAAGYYYGTLKPSAEESGKLGFDSVVITRVNAGLYEDDGELRVAINQNSTPAEMANQFFQLDSVDDTRRVEKFRARRADVKQLQAELSEKLGREVSCILSDRAENSVNIEECQEGLKKLKVSFAKSAASEKPITPQKILIGDLQFSDSRYSSEKNIIVLDADDAKVSELYVDRKIQTANKTSNR
jgi:hypothetical protein